ALAALQQAARDDEALDLARALVDARDADVARVALDRILARVAVAAVHLDGGVAGAPRRLRRVQLRHRRLARERLAVLLEPRRAHRQQARRLELGGGVGEAELDRLKVGERPAELHARLDVG